MQVLSLEELFSMEFKSHPWHGVSPKTEDRQVLRGYIEMVPDDRVKMELNKKTGHLEMDRPQKFAVNCPMLYGFIPQTYCGELVAERCRERTGKKVVSGDLDPLDICVITENRFSHGDIFIKVVPIGGLAMIDNKQADDKVICVLAHDIANGGITDVSELETGVITRLENYFLSYKRNLAEKSRKHTVKIAEVYGAKEARHIIDLSMRDYRALYGTHNQRLQQLRALLLSPTA